MDTEGVEATRPWKEVRTEALYYIRMTFLYSLALIGTGLLLIILSNILTLPMSLEVLGKGVGWAAVAFGCLSAFLFAGVLRGLAWIFDKKFGK